MVVHLNLCFHCFLLYTEKMGLDGLELQFNFDRKQSTDQNKQIYTITSDICQLFFDWNKDLKNPCFDSEEMVVFVKTLDKVNEKPADNLVGGNLSIHPSIYLAIHPSIHPSINPSMNF